MWEKINSLSLPLKIAIGAGILVISIFLLDLATGWVSNFRSYLYHKDEAATMKKVDELQQQVDTLKGERDTLVTKAIEKDAQIAALQEKEKANAAKDKVIDEKLSGVLEEYKREAAITDTDTDAYTRCERVRTKLIAQNINSANNINCEQYR